jgi:aspartyl-tRNA(Asn)/glutamyl-tRNA(Gln) amidotransferase subunit B
MANYFEAVVANTKAPAKIAANWIIGDLSGTLNKNDLSIEQSPIDSKRLAGLLDRIADNTISGKIAKTVFEFMWTTSKSADDIITEQGLKQMTDTGELESIIDKVIADNQNQLAEYKAGKEALFGFFVGQAMKATKGKGNPQQINDLLKKKLS